MQWSIEGNPLVPIVALFTSIPFSCLKMENEKLLTNCLLNFTGFRLAVEAKNGEKLNDFSISERGSCLVAAPPFLLLLSLTLLEVLVLRLELLDLVGELGVGGAGQGGEAVDLRRKQKAS